jgi:hypothetical protein
MHQAMAKNVVDAPATAHDALDVTTAAAAPCYAPGEFAAVSDGRAPFLLTHTEAFGENR